MDVSGFCLGHKMSKEEFLRRYCGGVEPETKTNKNSLNAYGGGYESTY